MSLQRRGGRPRRSLLGRDSRRRREASRRRALSSGRRPDLPIDGPGLSLLEWHCVVTRRALDVLRRFTKERDLPVSLRRRSGNDRRPRSVRRHERSSGHSRWHRDGWRRRPVVRFLGWCSGRRFRRRRCPVENADCSGAPADEHCFWRTRTADDVHHECKVRPFRGGIGGLARVRLGFRGRPCDSGTPRERLPHRPLDDPR